MPKVICVFGGSSDDVAAIYTQAAVEFGRLIAFHQWILIGGGTNSGPMKHLARSVQDGGGKVVAVIPRMMSDTPYVYTDADEIVVTESLSDRKDSLVSMSEAFVVFPGGLGTLDEAVTVVTLKYFRLHSKPIVFMNVNGFFDTFLTLMTGLVKESFLRPDELEALYLVEPTPVRVIDLLK